MISVFKKNRIGFTLVELLIVIAIIGILSTTAVVNISSARDKAKIAKVLQQIESVHLALRVYGSDVGNYPLDNCRLDCDQNTDPFSTQQTGEIGWSGPYLSLYNMAHPWGGHIGIFPASILPIAGSPNWDNLPDTILECTGLVLDDDLPQTTISDNNGVIPANILLAIDEKLDDGNLATGKVRGNTDLMLPNGWDNVKPALNELVIVMGCY